MFFYICEVENKAAILALREKRAFAYAILLDKRKILKFVLN